MWKSSCLVLLCVFLATCNPSVEAKDTNCKDREASLAKLDMAKEAMDKVREFFPSCTEYEKNSTHPGCGKRDKSLGYLDAAMDLVKSAIELYPKNPDEIKKPDPDEDKKKPDPDEDKKPDPDEDKKPEPKYGKQTDCSNILAKGYNESGVYTIYLTNDEGKERSLDVFCDMETAKGGWTVIQRRGDFPVQENFYRNWDTYKKGFGDVKQDFWIGNENLYDLTNKSSYAIRFDLVDADGKKGYAIYKSFSIEGESDKYKLHIKGYSGNVGDAMEIHNKKTFATKDNENSNYGYGKNCATLWKGGWWYGDDYCHDANLNGVYRKGVKYNGSSIIWAKWRTQNEFPLSATEIKLKRM